MKNKNFLDLKYCLGQGGNHQGRLVFEDDLEHSEAKSTDVKIPAINELVEKPDLNVSADFDNNPEVVFDKLSKEAYKDAKTQELGKADFKKAVVDKLTQNGYTLDSVWKKLQQDCSKVTIKNGVFEFLDKNDTPIKIKKNTVEIQFTATRISVREVNTAKEQQLAAQKAAEEKSLQARKKFLRTEGPDGKLIFDKGKTGLDQYLKTKISTLYANASVGDTVVINRSGKIITALNTGKDTWVTVDKKGKVIPGLKVIIEPNDKLTYVPNSKEANKTPKLPDNLRDVPTIGFMRISENMSWREIATKIMTTNESLYGSQNNLVSSLLNKLGLKSDTNSPKAVLESLGYDADNGADVERFAKLLESNNKKPSEDPNALGVWVTIPNQRNPRLRETMTKDQENTALKQQAGERGAQEQDTVMLYNRHREKLLNNKDYLLPAEIKKVVENGLWKEFWNGNFSGKEKIKNGFALMGLSETSLEMSDIVLQTVKTGEFNFKKLLSALQEKKIGIYTNANGEPGDYGDFYDEYTYQATARKVEANIDANVDHYAGLTQEQISYYNKKAEKYGEKNVPENARGGKYESMKKILEGASYVMEGVSKLSVTNNVDFIAAKKRAEEALNEAGNGRAQGKLERTPDLRNIGAENIAAETFIQQFFNKKNSNGALEDIPTDKEGKKSRFELESSEAQVYNALEEKYCKLGKWNTAAVAGEMNNYITTAMSTYRGLAAKNPETAKDLQKRYGLEGKLLNLQDPNYMNNVLEEYGVGANLELKTRKIDGLRNMLKDGALAFNQTDKGQNNKATEVKEWVNYTEILNGAEHEATKDIARNIILQLEPGTKITEQDVKAAVSGIDKSIRAAEMKVQQKQIASINVAADTKDGKVQVGASVPIDNLPWGLHGAVGVAVDVAGPNEGKPMIGAMISKSFQNEGSPWETIVSAGAGVGFPSYTPTLSGNLDVGFRWRSEGSPNSAWRTEVTGGGGVGAALSFNVTNLRLGTPYLRAGVGRVKDGQNEYTLKQKENLVKNSFDKVESAKTVAEKAQALRTLPGSVGPALFETQANLFGVGPEGDQKLVDFYDSSLKSALTDRSLMEVYNDMSGLSEAGIGVSIDARLVILAAATATLGPVAGVALGVAFYGKLAVVVDREITLHQELKEGQSKGLNEADAKMLELIKSKFPGIDIKVDAQRFDKSKTLVSSEFSGAFLEKMIPGGNKDKVKNETLGNFKSNEAITKFTEKQKEFAENHLALGFDAETNMYTIMPTEVESFKILLDPKAGEKHGLILDTEHKANNGQNRILVATTKDLNNLTFKRFTYIPPREIDGAVKQTYLTISDNPARTMEQIISSSDSYLESNYNRNRNQNTLISIKNNLLKSQEQLQRTDGIQINIKDLTKIKKDSARDGKDYLRTLYNAQDEADENSNEISEETLRADLEMTKRALDSQPKLADSISLKGLAMTPEAFMKTPEFRLKYKNLSTDTDSKKMKQLYQLVEDKNPGITADQKIIYIINLFNLSMSEGKNLDRETTINSRLGDLGEKVYKKKFDEGLAKLKKNGRVVPAEITGETLAKVYLNSIRLNLGKEGPAYTVKPGMSLETLVATDSIMGVRGDQADSGQGLGIDKAGSKSKHSVTDAYSYDEVLSSSTVDPLNQNQRLIAEILLDRHSDLHEKGTNEEFLQSRLAKKLYTMGDIEQKIANPLMNMLDENPEASKQKFRALTGAYEEINGKNGNASSEAFAEGVQSLKEVCKQIREAQLGKGIPVKLDDGSDAMARRINGYYVVIKTTLQSGIYEKCLNPSSTYNEMLFIYTPEQFLPSVKEGNLVSGSRLGMLDTSKALNVMSIGAAGVVRGEFGPKKRPPSEFPTPKEPTPGQGGSVDQTAGDETGGTKPVVVPNSQIGANGNENNAK